MSPRLGSATRLAINYISAITSYRPLIVGIALLCVASVLLNLMTQNDVSASDALAAAGGLVKSSYAVLPDTGVDDGSSAVGRDNDRPPSPLFTERPLVLLTLSYHAAPIYDLMDQLQPLGVQFIERGINAYACRYFRTCRQDGLLEACSHSSYIIFTFSLYSADGCTILMERL